jgi:hypothetical protein
MDKATRGPIEDSIEQEHISSIDPVVPVEQILPIQVYIRNSLSKGTVQCT